jgi:hypothetical protein
MRLTLDENFGRRGVEILAAAGHDADRATAIQQVEPGLADGRSQAMTRSLAERVNSATAGP